MAIEEVKDLESIEYFPGRKAINILWKNKIIRDGEVIHEENHRGSLPVDDNGNLRADDEKILGKKLKDVLGQAGKDALLIALKKEMEVSKIRGEFESEKISKAEMIGALQDQLANLTATNVALESEKNSSIVVVGELREEVELLKRQLLESKVGVVELEASPGAKQAGSGEKVKADQ